MRRLLILLVAAMLLVGAACGDGNEGNENAARSIAGTPPTASSPTPASPTQIAPSPTPVATNPQEEPAPMPPTTPPPSPETEPDPSEAYFNPERVLDISIQIDIDDWDVLRNQTRTFEDLMAEIGEYGLSQPFSDIYSWFPATVTVDGETHTEVGVRKKGFIGSQSSTKPALKLRFDKYVDEQTLGGVIERMTLNNSVQDSSMLNTCLTYRVFIAAGNIAPRCNFATVSVNGSNLGLYVHVEEIKTPFLSRHFDSTEGNIYEGTVSDFTKTYRGTIEKKNNEDADDWSDIQAVVEALEDSSERGLNKLDEIVDLDRFLTFWATEVLVGHWDGYAGNRNNYWFYREPQGRFVFIPWGVDGTFHLAHDPNPFDNITDPPPSVLALSAIPNRLYNHPDWREAYAGRLKAILDTAWDEDELLALVDEMAVIVQLHALPEEAEAAIEDTDRVLKFIHKRRGEILADLIPSPPDWPGSALAPLPPTASETIEVAFETTWGSRHLNPDPLGFGSISSLLLNGSEESVENVGVFSGYPNQEEKALLPEVAATAAIVLMNFEEDGSISGMTLVVDLTLLEANTKLAIGSDAIAGGAWYIPPGAADPEWFYPFTEGTLELSRAGTEAGDAVVGSFSGVFRDGAEPDPEPAGGNGARSGLVINEIVARGDPLDWFELYNASSEPIALDGFALADSLTDAAKRVAFPAGAVLQPGEYMQITLDKDGWPGFALGRDEELGIWLLDGTGIARADWQEGQSDQGQSFARIPDVTGNFRTVDNPTPGAPNHP